MDLDVRRIHLSSPAILFRAIGAVTVVSHEFIGRATVDDDPFRSPRYIDPSTGGLEIAITGLVDVDINIHIDLRYFPFFILVTGIKEDADKHEKREKYLIR